MITLMSIWQTCRTSTSRQKARRASRSLVSQTTAWSHFSSFPHVIKALNWTFSQTSFPLSSFHGHTLIHPAALDYPNISFNPIHPHQIRTLVHTRCITYSTDVLACYNVYSKQNISLLLSSLHCILLYVLFTICIFVNLNSLYLTLRFLVTLIDFGQTDSK